jgi:hypothetical protein
MSPQAHHTWDVGSPALRQRRAASERRAMLDAALRDMVRDCPVSDRIRSLLDQLDGSPARSGH